MEEAREQEVQLQGKVKALELQVQAQADREHEVRAETLASYAATLPAMSNSATWLTAAFPQ